MVITETTTKCTCSVCVNPIPPLNVQESYDAKNGEHWLFTYCAVCDVTTSLQRKGYGQWRQGQCLPGDHVAAFKRRMGAEAGDVQAGKPNTAAAKKTLAMAAGTYH